jgi:hypothetical protein
MGAQGGAFLVVSYVPTDSAIRGPVRSELGFREDDNAPTVALELGRWGFHRVHSGQLRNDRTSDDAHVHLTVDSAVNTPNVPIDTDDW